MLKRDDKAQKTFWQRMLYSQLIIVIGLVCIILFFIGISKKKSREAQINKETAELLSQVEHLEKSNKELADLISYFNSADFVEEEARTKLDLRKEGENVAIISKNSHLEIVSNNIANNSSQKIENNAQQEKSNPSKWFNYFFQ